MAFEFINEAKTIVGSSSLNITISKPTDTAQNDIMIWYILWTNGYFNVSPPSWWIKICESVPYGSTQWVWLRYKVAWSSEWSNYQRSSDTWNTWKWIIITYRWQDTITPVDKYSNVTFINNNNDVKYWWITVTNNNSIVLIFGSSFGVLSLSTPSWFISISNAYDWSFIHDIAYSLVNSWTITDKFWALITPSPIKHWIMISLNPWITNTWAFFQLF